jgi:hypothetical protein
MELDAGGLSIAIDDVVDGIEVDNPRTFAVLSPRDITDALVECGAPETDARAACRALWHEGQAVARAHVERVLITVREQPFPERYLLHNQWTRVDGDNLTRVTAGALADRPSQGVAVVARASARVPLVGIAEPAEWISVGEVRTPAECGALRIDTAAGDVVGLVAADGSEWRLAVARLELLRFSG